MTALLVALCFLAPPSPELDKLRQAVERDPQDVELRHALAGQLIENGALGEAETTLREVVRRAPDRVDALVDLGMLLLDLKKAEDALPFLERAHAAAPTDEDALAGMVSALIDLGRPDEAVAALPEPSARLRPLRAFAYLRSDRPVEALADLHEVLRTRPDEWPLRVLAAVAHAVRGDLDAADREVDQASERAPATAANVPYARAFVAFLRGNVGRAQRSMSDARQKAPGAFEPRDPRFTPMAFATRDEVVFLDWASKLPVGPALRVPDLELTLGRSTPKDAPGCTRATLMAALLDSPERLARCSGRDLRVALTAKGVDARGGAAACLRTATRRARAPLADGVTCRATLTLLPAP